MISDQSQRISTDTNLKEIQVKDRSVEELRGFVEEYSPSRSILKVIKNARKPLGISKKTTIIAGIKYFLLNCSKNVKTNYNYFGRTKFKVFKHSLDSMLKEKYRRSFMDKSLVTNVDYSSKFVYFPLGVDMERNILVAAPFFTNQVEIIRHIAKSLPVGYQLYVKEAPAAATRSWREISVYKEIMDIPNVTLIHPNVKSEKLLENCKIVSTVGGSTGFQATFYKKPTIIFSETVYSILPSVFQVKDVRVLPNVIKKAIETRVDISDLDRYITLIDDNTFEFDLYQLQNNFTKMFYYNGTLIDTNIDEAEVEIFLKKNKNMLSFLAERYQEKIEESKNVSKKTKL
tara:strand:- start:155 stop:1186 length:1032 start_codon:yes stop_codon:yes gene_type:complete